MRHQRKLFCLVLVFGLGIRLALAFYWPHDLTSDNDGYLAHAHSVANGSGFLGPFSHQPTAFRPPAYPIMLGLLLACGVTDASAVLFINVVASLLILWLTRKLAIQSGLPEKVALIATLAVAVDPLLARYSILPMTEVPCTAVLLAAIVYFHAAITNQQAQFRNGLIAGILFGIGILIRPIIMISLSFVSLHAIMRALLTKDSDHQSHSRRLNRLLPAVVAGLVLIPWIIRNGRHFDRFIPATTHGGYTLALGNNPDFYRDVINGPDTFPWDGPALDAWQKRMMVLAKREGVPPEDEPAMDSWYYRQALSAIQGEPVSFLKATFLRLRRFWAVSTADAGQGDPMLALVAVWYILLWCGLALERWAAWRLRKTEQYPSLADLWLVVLSFMLMHAFYWTDTRMRAPLMPFLIVLSLVGWSFAAVQVRRGPGDTTNSVSGA